LREWRVVEGIEGVVDLERGSVGLGEWRIEEEYEKWLRN
jgi:hypothetical protein